MMTSFRTTSLPVSRYQVKMAVDRMGSQPMSVSAWNTTQAQLQEAMHVGEPAVLSDSFVLNVDLVQTGVGGTDSWSQRARPYDWHRLLDKNYSYDFWMVPVRSLDESVDAGRKYNQ